MKQKTNVDDIVHIPKTVGIRHLQCIMLLLALVLAMGMRVNMSLAVVAMTDQSNENSFNWSMQMQSVILSSFFWGYIILQIPGSLVADKVGANVLISIGIGINSVISLLLPTAAYYGGSLAVCACRVLQGLTQGILYPCINNLIAKWVPLEEKSRLSTFIYAGSQLGTAAMLISGGFLADYWGWASIFYLVGTLGVIWTTAYLLIGAASPQSSKMISDEERLYIQSSLGHVGGHKTFATPWKSLLTSIPFLSLMVAHCGQQWGYWTLLTEIPSYMRQVLGVNIKANGVLSALPYIAMYALSFPFGFLSDYILSNKWVSITATRKISNSIGQFGPAVFLIGLGFVPAGNITLAVGLLTMIVGFNAGHFTGFMICLNGIPIFRANQFKYLGHFVTEDLKDDADMERERRALSVRVNMLARRFARCTDEVVHLDMSPNFAGIMLGITNCTAHILSIFAPLTAGAMIRDESNPAEWRKIFYLSSCIYIVSNTFYIVFGTSEKQSWNEPDNAKESVENALESECNKNTEKTRI